MKDGILLLVVGVIAIGGIILWQSHVDPFALGRSMGQDRELRPEPQPEVPAPKPAPVHKPKPVVKAPEVVEAVPAPVETPVAAVSPEPPAPPVVHDPPPFPAVDQIASGAPEETVTGKYGDPAISAVTSSGGHMVGTYVYAREGGRVATVIHLEDGVVASATSKSSPPPVAGLSVPRRKQAN